MRSSPSLFEPYANTSFPAVDEWTLSENLGNDTSAGGLAGVLTKHYETFVVSTPPSRCLPAIFADLPRRQSRTLPRSQARD